MTYHCGHKGCDICGARECDYPSLCLVNFAGYLACPGCVEMAVKFAVDAAETFGGTIIDPAKPCKEKK